MSRMNEWKGRKMYTINLRLDSVCVWTLNLAPSFLAGTWKKETGWVSWLLSDKEPYQFFSREKSRKSLGYKGAEFIHKECTFSRLLRTLLKFSLLLPSLLLSYTQPCKTSHWQELCLFQSILSELQRDPVLKYTLMMAGEKSQSVACFPNRHKERSYSQCPSDVGCPSVLSLLFDK